MNEDPEASDDEPEVTIQHDGARERKGSEPVPESGPGPTVAPGTGTSTSLNIEKTLTDGARPVPKQKPDEYVPCIPDVSITGQLGVGGQGIVFRGYQEYLDRDVAVKVLHRHIDPSFSRRFQREAKILAGLHHANIVACHQAGVTDDDHCYMVMEFIDGPDLTVHVNKSGPLDESAAFDVVRDVALALEHGLESSIIHRDVKPQNVLLQTTVVRGITCMRAKLADLGLARCTEENASMPNLTVQGTVMGTPTTMAPEQFDAPDEVDHRADIYGLGCVLVFALTGKPAFEGATLTELYRMKTAAEVPRMLTRISGVSPGARDLIAQMLAPDADDRPQTYGALLKDIESARSGGGPGSVGRTPLVIGATVGVAALVALLAFNRGGAEDLSLDTDTSTVSTDPRPGVIDPSPANGDTTAPIVVAIDDEEPPPQIALDPLVPAEGLRPFEQWSTSKKFLAGWTGADAGMWMPDDLDLTTITGIPDGEVAHPVIEHLCPEGPWTLGGHVDVNEVYSRSKTATFEAGIRLVSATGSVLELRAVLVGKGETQVAHVQRRWSGGESATDLGDLTVDVGDAGGDRVAAFDFEVTVQDGRVLLGINGQEQTDVSPDTAKLTTFSHLQLFVDAGEGSWSDFKYSTP